MPRLGVRRRAPTPTNSRSNNNNAGEDGEGPQRKIPRVAFRLPLPERPKIVGRALVCGQGDMGQLGLGEDDSKFERKRPALLESIENVVDVCAGGMHNIVLTSDGSVYSFGCNDEGALGRDSSDNGAEFEPRQIDLPGKVLMISAGDSHSACLLQDGRVYAWGSFRDSHGNMGLTMEGNKRLPIDVLPNIQCCNIASGADHLVILTCLGKVYTVGCGEQGQLGRVSMRSASGESRRGKTDLLHPGVVSIKRGGLIEAIWTTNYCTFLRETRTNKIWSFGLNNFRQLVCDKNRTMIITPISTNLENVKEISGGQHHTLVLKDDGTCYVIGRGDYGRLGLGPDIECVLQLTPIRSVLEGKQIVSVSCGEAQSFAVTAAGQLYSWGMGSNHQLGTGTEEDAFEPVLILSKQTQDKRIIRSSSGGQHSIFLVEDEEQPKPALTKKAAAAAAAKEKEAKRAAAEAKEQEQQPKADNSSSTAVETTDITVAVAADSTAAEPAKTNGDADTEMSEGVSVEEKSSLAVVDSKTSNKRGRKKK